MSAYIAFSKLSKELRNFKKQKIYELRLEHIAPTSVIHSLPEAERPNEVNFFELLQDYGEDYCHYPKAFIEDISKGYHRKLNEYENLLREEGVKHVIA